MISLTGVLMFSETLLCGDAVCAKTFLTTTNNVKRTTILDLFIVSIETILFRISTAGFEIALLHSPWESLKLR